jgi:hypothetical protein
MGSWVTAEAMGKMKKLNNIVRGKDALQAQPLYV